MKKNLLLFNLLFILLVTSCHKTNKIENGESDNDAKRKLQQISSSLNFSDFPSIEDGTLVFRDDEHYDSYVNFLESAMVGGDPDDPNVDVNSILQNIEDGLGFTSIRSLSHADFMAKNETGWLSFEEIPEEHFLSSPDLKSILNPKLEVKIGNDLVRYINKDYAVRVDARQAGLV